MCVNKEQREFAGVSIRTNRDSHLCVIGDVLSFKFISGHSVHCMLERVWTIDDQCYLDVHFLI